MLHRVHHRPPAATVVLVTGGCDVRHIWVPSAGWSREHTFWWDASLWGKAHIKPCANGGWLGPAEQLAMWFLYW